MKMPPSMMSNALLNVANLGPSLTAAFPFMLHDLQGRSFVWAPIFAAHLGPHFGVRSLIHFSKMEPIVAYSLLHGFLMNLATIAEMAARFLADSAQAESNAKRKVVSLDMLLPPLHSCNTVPLSLIHI